jgi:hypothetical protein
MPGVCQIAAHSPQAKGRIERLWGTFQDRLVSELRLANARTIEEANCVLARVVAEHNRRFHRQPGDPNDVYRKPERGTDLDALFCFGCGRSVAMDNTVSFFGRVVQIERGPGGKSYARCWVDVQQRFDGSLHVYCQNRCIAKTDPPPVPPSVLRVRHANGRYTQECQWTAPRESPVPKHTPMTASEPKQPKTSKPAANHPWRRPWVT